MYLSYQVQYRVQKANQTRGDWFSFFVEGSTTSASISNLEADTQYALQVAAKNSKGSSNFSAVVIAETLL